MKFLFFSMFLASRYKEIYMNTSTIKGYVDIDTVIPLPLLQVDQHRNKKKKGWYNNMEFNPLPIQLKLGYIQIKLN